MHSVKKSGGTFVPPDGFRAKKLSEGRQLFVELFVDALPVPWFPGGSHGPLRREPADPAVFIELGPDVRGGSASNR